jgi:hypothetical protein
MSVIFITYLQDMNPASVGGPTNLAVPMTPLGGGGHHHHHHHPHMDRGHDHYTHPVPSNIHTVQPNTPASASDVPQPQLQNIVSTVNLGIVISLECAY